MYRLLIRKYHGKRKHGRPSVSWERILKFVLKDIISDYVVWTHVAQDRGK